MRHYFVEEIVETLAKRAVAIEPAGIRASVGIELT